MIEWNSSPQTIWFFLGIQVKNQTKPVLFWIETLKGHRWFTFFVDCIDTNGSKEENFWNKCKACEMSYDIIHYEKHGERGCIDYNPPR
jgi:hypothetical protein